MQTLWKGGESQKKLRGSSFVSADIRHSAVIRTLFRLIAFDEHIRIPPLQLDNGSVILPVVIVRGGRTISSSAEDT